MPPKNRTSKLFGHGGRKPQEGNDTLKMRNITQTSGSGQTSQNLMDVLGEEWSTYINSVPSDQFARVPTHHTGSDFINFLRQKTQKTNLIDAYSTLCNKKLTGRDVVDISLSLEELLDVFGASYSGPLVLPYAQALSIHMPKDLQEKRKNEVVSRFNQQTSLGDVEHALLSFLQTHQQTHQQTDVYVQVRTGPIVVRDMVKDVLGEHIEPFQVVTSHSDPVQHLIQDALEVYTQRYVIDALYATQQLSQELERTMKTPTRNRLLQIIEKKPQYSDLLDTIFAHKGNLRDMPGIYQKQLMRVMKEAYLTTHNDGSFLTDTYNLPEEQKKALLDALFVHDESVLRVTTSGGEQLEIPIRVDLQNFSDDITTVDQLKAMEDVPMMISVDIPSSELAHFAKNMQIGQSQGFFTLPGNTYKYHPDQLVTIRHEATGVTYPNCAIKPLGRSADQQWEVVHGRHNFWNKPHTAIPVLTFEDLDEYAIVPQESGFFLAGDDLCKLLHVVGMVYAGAELTPAQKNKILAEREQELLESYFANLDDPSRIHPDQRRHKEGEEGDKEDKEGDEEGKEGDEEDKEGEKEDKEGDKEDKEGEKEDKEGDKEDKEGEKEDKEGEKEDKEGDKEDKEGEKEDKEGEKEDKELDKEGKEGDKEGKEGEEEAQEGEEEAQEGAQATQEGDEEDESAGSPLEQAENRVLERILGDKIEGGLASRPTFYLEVGPSFCKGGGNRYWKLQVDRVSSRDITVTVSSTESNTTPVTKTLPRDEDTLPSLLEKNPQVSQVYSFKQHGSAKDWGMHIKEHLDPTQFTTSSSKLKDFLNYARGELFFNSIKNHHKQDFAYFGLETEDVVDGKLTPSVLMYKVDYQGPNIRVSDPRQGFDTTMDYNEFMLFVAQKKLKGYTQDDYDKLTRAENQEQSPLGSDHKKGLQWFSIGNVLSGFGALWDAGKQKLKDWDEERGTRFLRNLKKGQFVKLLGALPIVGDAFSGMAADVLAEIDGEIWKKIEEYKEACKTKGGLGGSKPSEYIAGLLKNANSVRSKDPLILAGALLYAMESGGSLYFRKLGTIPAHDLNLPGFTHQEPPYGLWVYALIGQDGYKEWQKYHNKLLVKAEADPGNTDIADELANSELRFIFKTFDEVPGEQRDSNGQSQWERIYGMKFRGYLQGQITMGLFASNKIKSAKDEMMEKSFVDVYNDDFSSSVKQLRMERVLASQEALGEKVGDSEERYKQWTFSMLAPMVTGIHQHHFNSVYKNHYKDLARRYGFPFIQYADDMHSRIKLQRLFDAVTDGSFSQQVSLGSLEDGAKDFGAVYSKFEVWWHQHGASVMDSLQDPGKVYKRIDALRDKGGQDNIDKANELLHFMNEGVMSNDIDTVPGGITSPDSLIYKKHLFSLPPGVVQQVLNQFTPSGQYRGNNPQATALLWETLAENIKSRAMDKVDSKDEFIFYTKKFFQWFNNYMTSDYKRELLAILNFYPNGYDGTSKKELLQHAIRGAFGKNSGGESLPSAVSSALEAFEQFFDTNSEYLQYDKTSLIKNALLYPDYQDAQLNKDKNDIMKKQLNRRKRLRF